MIQYFIPLGVLSYTYSRISFVVWGIQHDRPSVGQVNLNRNTRTDTRSRKVRLYFKSNNKDLYVILNLYFFQAVLLTLAVVVGFLLAWGPLNIDIILRHDRKLTNEYISIACHWLAMSHCFYNPLIYAWINNSFKVAFKDVYMKVVCCVKTGNGAISRCNNGTKSSFSTNMSTRKWKSYRKISITPEPYALVRQDPSCAGTRKHHEKETRY